MTAEPLVDATPDEYGRGPLVRMDHESRGITTRAAILAELAATRRGSRRTDYSIAPCLPVSDVTPPRPQPAGDDLRTLLADLIAETVDQQLGPARDAWAKQEREIARLRREVEDMSRALVDHLAAGG